MNMRSNPKPFLAMRRKRYVREGTCWGRTLKQLNTLGHVASSLTAVATELSSIDVVSPKVSVHPCTVQQARRQKSVAKNRRLLKKYDRRRISRHLASVLDAFMNNRLSPGERAFFTTLTPGVKACGSWIGMQHCGMKRLHHLFRTILVMHGVEGLKTRFRRIFLVLSQRHVRATSTSKVV